MTNPPLPALGSDLLSQARLAAARPSRPSLQTSSPSIDAAIGGVQYGRITSLQCDIGGHGTLLAYYIVASYLLSIVDDTSQVAYVDTTGAFSAVNLLQVLMRRLQQDATHAQEAGATSVRDTAAQLLDRVQYMRAFDFDGVVETVEEVTMGIQTETDADAEPNIAQEERIIVEEEEVDTAGISKAEDADASSASEVQSLVVPDSLADSDEEIFWPLPPLLKDDAGIRRKRRKEEGKSEVEEEKNTQSHPPSETNTVAPPIIVKCDQAKTVGLLIVDNISRPVEGLLDTNEVAAHAALTQLSRKLRSLARDRGMTILLLSSPAFQQGKYKDRRDIYARNVSIFAGIEVTDGLVQTLNNNIDMSVMISKYPQPRNHKRRSGGREAFVVEVLSQRYDDGEGQWGAFTVKDGTELVDFWPVAEESK
ncbi:hypothetical protein TWF696_003219 [Orbilia brochopaga]|uniref:DNA recombination and repair protein Rad51-like C-terminal domain-containing protein n=1 Tax=Orbilia brochopaga TaxID=3140254 RepID=A0AAV9TY04_9PEZI